MAQQSLSASRCTPDSYLTQEQLEAIFTGFKASISASLPLDSVFSHLVNEVRQPYISHILALQQGIIGQSDERYKQQLSELREKYEDLLNQVNIGRDKERNIPPVYSKESTTGEKPAIDILPAETSRIHIGTALGPQRDMVGWDSQSKSGWTERFEFRVFRFLEIGTIKIAVGERDTDGPHRVNVFLPTSIVPMGWKERLHFYAFESQRPDTIMISVGQANDPERCIFVRGDHADKLNGWTEKFVFWVPTHKGVY